MRGTCILTTENWEKIDRCSFSLNVVLRKVKKFSRLEAKTPCEFIHHGVIVRCIVACDVADLKEGIIHSGALSLI